MNALKAREDNVAAILKLWAMLMPAGEMPTAFQCFLWLGLHPIERVLDAVTRTARKAQGTPGMSLDYKIRFVSSVANRAKTDAENKSVECAAGVQ
jgi:hypothetical protein